MEKAITSLLQLVYKFVNPNELDPIVIIDIMVSLTKITSTKL